MEIIPIVHGLISRIKTAKNQVRARLLRLRLGNFGDAKTIRGAKQVYELRIHLGPGYRIYFTKEGKRVVLLLIGGSKQNQSKDIKKAIEYWQEYKQS
ncbi:MAG: hypothetical protein ChlgKO_06200 [Chlamydiales bacterium]